MEYKKLLLNIAISAIIGAILGLSLYKLFLGVTVCFIAYIMHETWSIGIENYFGLANLSCYTSIYPIFMEEENMDTWYCNIFPYMDILYILLSIYKI